MTKIKRVWLWFSVLVLVQACGAPVVAPTATATALPLPTATNTVVPTATASPAPTETPAPTASATVTADPLHTACDHPYWPLREGATWEYTDGSATWTQEVIDVTGDLTHATATLVTRYASGDSVTFTHDCSEAGSWNAQTVTDFAGVQSTTIFTGTGVQMLAGPLLMPGATWHFEGELNFTSTSGQTATNQAFYDYLALPLEAKETVAGSFQTLPVLIEFTSSTSVAGQPSTTTDWYAANVGLVYADVGGSTKWDLVSYSIP